MELKLSTLGAALAITVTAGNATWNDATKTLTASDGAGPPQTGTGPGGIPTRWWNGDGSAPSNILQWSVDNNYLPVLSYDDGTGPSRFGYGTLYPSTDFSAKMEPGYVVYAGQGAIANPQPNPNPNPNPTPQPPAEGAIHLPQGPHVRADGSLIYPLNNQCGPRSMGLGGTARLLVPYTLPPGLVYKQLGQVKIEQVPGQPVIGRNVALFINGAPCRYIQFDPSNWNNAPGYTFTTGHPDDYLNLGAQFNQEPGDSLEWLVINQDGVASDVIFEVQDTGR